MLRVLFAGSWTAVTPDAALRWLVALPLLGALFNATCGRWLEARPRGRQVVAGVGIVAVVLTGVLALGLVLGPLCAAPPEARRLVDHVASFLSLGSVHAELTLLLDPLSAVMVLVITLVGALIHVFAAGYMDHEPALARFFALLNGFVAAMLVLVLGDGFVTLFLGWEGVGLCSALLIGFWWREPANGRAANKAFVVNRVGDLGLLFAMSLLFWTLGGSFSGPGQAAAYLGTGRTGVVVADPSDLSRVDTSHDLAAGPSFVFREQVDTLALRQIEHGLPGRRVFAEALGHKRLWGLPVLWLVCLGLFVAACGKSAQLPLAIWLPEAMAGPTPVSALIHAATMVTAGVYLLARTSFLFALLPAFGVVVAVVGAVTALLAALAAAVQHDLKRVLAFSTISQLGFMFMAVGAGDPAAGLLHVVTHACFKACLFLAAGAVIHALAELGGAPPVNRALDYRRGYDAHNPQDMRNMGGLGRRLPLVRAAYFAGCWAIAGLPFGAGFFSKDAILEAIFASSPLGAAGPFIGASALCTAGLTAFYTFRSYYLVFEGRKTPWKTPRATATHLHAPSWGMSAVLVVLAVASLTVGAWLGWPALFHGSGSESPAREPLLMRWLAPVWRAAQERLVERTDTGELLPRLAWDFMGMGLVVAVAGWYFARLFFKDEARSRPFRERAQNRFDVAHAAAFSFFHLDELLRAAVVQPVRTLSRVAARLDIVVVDGLVNQVARCAQSVAAGGAAFDSWFVDGAVNGVARLLSRAGRRLSRIQSGRLPDYLLASLLGLLAVALVVMIVLLGSR